MDQMDIMEAIRRLLLPPGFSFRPTDVELLRLLRHKFQGLPIAHNIIRQLDIYEYNPWDLSAKSHPILFLSCSDTNPPLYFFTPRSRKYPNGSRANRCTLAGFWKITGRDRIIKHRNCKFGIKKTLVFHLGRPPSGTGTDWIMHEYSLHEDQCKDAPHLKDLFVLCRITKRDTSSSDADHSKVQPVPDQLGADHLAPAAVHPDALMPHNSSTLAETLIDIGNTSYNNQPQDIANWPPDLIDPLSLDDIQSIMDMLVRE